MKLGLRICGMLVAAGLAGQASANGVGENGSWQFPTSADKVNQAAIVENKHLDAALAMAKLIQEQLPPKRRNLNEPSRRSQGAHMFPDPQPPAEEPIKRKRGRPPLPRLTPIEAVRRQLESM